MNDHRLSPDIENSIRKKIYDIPYALKSGSQILDLWYPEETEKGPYPVILHVHGGGFQYGGHREDSVEPMLKATQRGYVLASVEYRKSGEARFPAMVNDVKAAIRYLRANSEQYDLDPNRIGLWGPSCGGWAVSMAALTAGNKAFEDPSLGYAEIDTRVQAVVDWCGPCGNFLKMDEEFLASGKGRPDHGEEDSPESLFLGSKLENVADLCEMASPIRYVNRNMPPFFIVHGTEDAIVPVEQSIDFADAIRKTAGENKVRLVLAKGAPHHGRVWWHEPAVSDAALDFFDKILIAK